MTHRKIFIALVSASLLAGCATPNQPLTRAEIDNAVYWDQFAFSCARKGLAKDLSAIATYRSNWNSQLNARADPATVKAARQENFDKYTWAKVTPQDCRTVELYAVEAKNNLAQMRHQQQIQSQSQNQGGSWIDTNQIYQPRYASCLTTYGYTNCVAY